MANAVKMSKIRGTQLTVMIIKVRSWKTHLLTRILMQHQTTGIIDNRIGVRFMIIFINVSYVSIYDYAVLALRLLWTVEESARAEATLSQTTEPR